MSHAVIYKPGSFSLMKLLRQPVARQIATYTFTNFFGKAASFFLLFIFTNPLYITPAENGLLSLFSTGLLFLMPFLSMGLIHSASTDYFKLGKSAFKSQFTTGFTMAFLMMIVSASVMLLFRKNLSEAYGYPAMFCWLIPLITFLGFCHEQLLALLRNKNQADVFFRINTVKIVLELGISLMLVTGLAWRWQGRTAGVLSASLATTGFALWYFFRNGYLFGKISFRIFRQELVYAVPVIIMQISIFCMNASDKFFLAAFSAGDNATVGIYSIASVFAAVILALAMSLIQYVFPKIYSELSQPRPDQYVIYKSFRLYVFVLFSGCLFIACATIPAYKYFIHEKYHAALTYIFILLAANLVWSVAYFFYSFLLYFKEKRRILLLSVLLICISLASNYFMIKNFSATGAAWSALIIYVIAFCVILGVTKKYWQQFLFHANKNQNR